MKQPLQRASLAPNVAIRNALKPSRFPSQEVQHDVGPIAIFRRDVAGIIFTCLLLFGVSSFAQSSQPDQTAPGTNQNTTVAGTNLSPTDSTSGIMPPMPAPMVLTNPPPGPVPQSPSFSQNPTTQEIMDARVFTEPLVPLWGEPSQEENAALAKALTAFASRTNADDFSALTDYLANAPNEHWYDSVMFCLGLEYYNTGYYSKAIDSWEEVWFWLEDATDDSARLLADRTFGELAKMHARIGGLERLQELFQEFGNEQASGSANELIAGAKQAMWLMKNRPEIAYRCGPIALRNICKMIAPPGVAVDEIVLNSASTPGKGFSLDQLQKLSQDLHLDFQAAQRAPGAPVIVPSVVHWKVGHYAAILRQDGNRFFVVDPTFGISRWISQQALDTESSGYFLIPPGPLTNDWQSVSASVATNVWGRGVTGNSDPNATTPYDQKADPDCGSRGMATYNAHLLLVSLNIEDTPVSFTPPRGPAINFTVTYNQREANQPTTFNYSNFGADWTCNWISYLTDNGTNTPGDVQYYVDGGGTETFTGFNTTNQTFTIQWRDQAQLVRLSTTNYMMTFPDGSIQVFGQPDGTVGNSRKVFLTQVIDPTGYTNILNYDSKLRLVSVVDPQANVTNLTFFYDASQFSFAPYVIQQVTDRYGRSATFNYGGGTQLESITDVLGLTSQVFYAGSFINALQTPYGKSTFAFGDNGAVRWLEMTDPQGAKSRVEFNQSPEITGIPNSDPGPLVPYAPGAFFTRNYILFGRNTFFWDKKAMREAPGDYSKARLYHWLHNADLASAVGALESYKEPLENRVWFDYPGQPANFTNGSGGATIYGSLNVPSITGRVLDDGTSVFYQFYRNSLGKITNAIDPIGRSFTFNYATNQIDLLEVRQTRGTNNELVTSFTYNSQHLPLTSKDASGQTTKFAYNSYGQITGITNALSQVTVFGYSANGNLLSIDGPTNSDTINFGYDSLDRVNAVTNSDGYYVRMVYDPFDRPLTNTYPDGSTETVIYKYLDPQVYTDRGGKVTQFVYDSLRHLTQITEATNWTTHIGWCDCGDMDSITDPAGKVTSWIHDIQGRITAKQYADGSSVHYTYEKTTSRLKSFTNERGQTRSYFWYSDDNLNAVQYANTNVSPLIVYIYDTNYNRLTTMQDGYGVTSFNYHPIASSPALGAGRLRTIIDPNGTDTITYSYDALGRVSSHVLTNNLFIGTGPGPADQSETFTYDTLGRITADATSFLGTFTFAYSGSSPRLASITYPSTLKTTYAYDTASGDFRLLALTNNAGSTLLSRFNYTYDQNGRITNLVQRLGTIKAQTNRISYDVVGQVLNVTTNNNANAYNYTYDLAGNRTLENIGGTSSRAWFNPLNQIQGKDQGLSTARTYEWDEENRLVAVNEGTTRAEMVYNAFGRLVFVTEKNHGTNTMRHSYVWSGDKIVEHASIHNDNSATFHWFYDYGHYDTAGPTYYYTTRDALGSVREYYSVPAANLLKQYDYDPFGRQTTVVDGFDFIGGHIYYTTPPDFRFTGMLGMPGHNLDFATYRTYDPDLGRWLSRDPIAETGGLNLYQYAHNDPINQSDLDGLCPQQGFVGGPGQFRDPNSGQIRDADGNAAKDQLNPLNPLNFTGENSPQGIGGLKGPDSLIGVPANAIERVLARLQGLRIGNKQVVNSVEAFGSRAGSTFRGRGPLPTSDLDLIVSIRSDVWGSRSEPWVRSVLNGIAQDFQSEAGFPLSLHAPKAEDMLIFQSSTGGGLIRLF